MDTDQVTLDGGGRVRLDGSGSPPRTTGLEVAADQVVVRGLQVAGFPEYGIHVRRGGNVEIGSSTPGLGNLVELNGRAGIRLGDRNSTVRDVDVLGNELDRNCASPSGVCGNVEVFGTGQILNILVEGNVSTGALGNASQAQGTGILVGFGVGVRVVGNVVADNLGSGILAASNSGAIVVTGLQVVANVIHGNAKHGILLGPSTLGAQVTDNRVGAGIGNDGNGIMIFGSDGHLVVGNAVTANALGILMVGASRGDWQSDHLVADNRVGFDDDGTSAPNWDAGITSNGREGRSALERNVVSGSSGPGIVLADGGHTVTGNLVGTTPDGLAAAPNGGGPGGPFPAVILRGSGITFGGTAAWSPLPDPTLRNVVSGNAGPGIVVGLGAEDVTVWGNLVGLAADGETPLGNGGDGIVVDGAERTTIGSAGSPNVVGPNDGIGIVVASASGDTVDTSIDHNVVGLTVSGLPAGNGGDGIRVSAGGGAISGTTIADNVVSENLAVGIRVATAGSVDLQRNRITLNGACALKVTGGPGVQITPPTVSSATSRTIWGTFTVPAGMTLERIEVFWDDGDEMQEFLGVATITGSSWELHERAHAAMFPVNGRVVATTTVLPFHATSGIPEGCGDGCAVGVASCDDGNPCTEDVCTNGACSHPADDGVSCFDGDTCTTGDVCDAKECVATMLPPLGCAANTRCTELDPATGVMVDRTCEDGDECKTQNFCSTQTGNCVFDPHDQECGDGQSCTSNECLPNRGCVHPLMPSGTLCEDGDRCTGLGTCDPSGTCHDPEGVQEECPLEYTWSVGTCDPATGCTYEGRPDGYCGPDELCNDPFGDCLATIPNPAGAWGDGMVDSDQDGLPDLWEQRGGADLDGDGDFTDVLLPGADFTVPDIFVEIDYMVAADHDEAPIDDVSRRDEDTFREVVSAIGKVETYELHHVVDHLDPIPHHDVLTRGLDSDEVPTEASCADWVSLTDLKRDHFDPRRRGLYHYTVRGHRDCEGRNGTGELWGDDVALFVTSVDPVSGDWVISGGALLHELGHNLGLAHGEGGGGNFKPNYQSSMNYRYGGGMIVYDPGQVIDTGDISFDYSSSEADPLVETALVEDDGVFYPVDDPAYWVEYKCPNLLPPVTWWEPNAPIDWDCSGGPMPISAVPIQYDVNDDGVLGTLSGHDDWANLELKMACEPNGAPDFQDLSPTEVVDEWSEADMAHFGVLHPPLIPRSDLLPSCATSPVAEDRAGEVQLWLRGSARLDVSRITSFSLSRAAPIAQRLLDVDGDQVTDLMLAFATADLHVSPPRPWTWFEGELDNGRRVFGTVQLTWVPDFDDDDEDGVEDRFGCDLCPGVTAPAASPDGCL